MLLAAFWALLSAFLVFEFATIGRGALVIAGTYVAIAGTMLWTGRGRLDMVVRASWILAGGWALIAAISWAMGRNMIVAVVVAGAIAGWAIVTDVLVGTRKRSDPHPAHISAAVDRVCAMTTTAQDVFARHFPGLTPEEVDAELSRTPAAGATPISSAATHYLAGHGGEEARVALEAYDEAAVQQDRAIVAAQTLDELLQSSLTLEEAAGHMMISRSRVSHRIREQSLYAFTVQGRRYVPEWQLMTAATGARGAEPIPGLAQIVPLVPRDLHPLAVQAFMTGPSEDLDDRSPVEYLVSHGPREVVEDLLTALSHW